MKCSARTMPLFLILFTSCTKVIDIHLNDTGKKYVIEGTITNEYGTGKVKITQTNNFQDANEFAGVGGAVVMLKDNGVLLNCRETSPGLYETDSLLGTPGHLYELSVDLGGALFTASCVMPETVPFDSLYLTQGPFGAHRFATIDYHDPAGRDNAYRFVQYVNGVKEPAIYLEDDEFTDGLENIVQLDVPADKKDDPRYIKSGDQVVLEMLCVEESVEKYWSSLRDGGGTGIGSNAAPANPVTNIKGGALGYFSAHTIQRKELIAP